MLVKCKCVTGQKNKLWTTSDQKVKKVHTIVSISYSKKTKKRLIYNNLACNNSTTFNLSIVLAKKI